MSIDMVLSAAENELLAKHVQALSDMQRVSRGGRKRMWLVMRPALAHVHGMYFARLNAVLEARMLMGVTVRTEDDMRPVVGINAVWVNDVVWVSRGGGSNRVCGHLWMS